VDRRRHEGNGEPRNNIEPLQGRVMKMQMLLEGCPKYSRVGRMDRTTEDVAIADGVAEFRVSDDGAGIPDEFHQRIFRIFQTLASRDDPRRAESGWRSSSGRWRATTA
jgi:hypothetical protein